MLKYRLNPLAKSDWEIVEKKISEIVEILGYKDAASYFYRLSATYTRLFLETEHSSSLFTSATSPKDDRDEWPKESVEDEC